MKKRERKKNNIILLKMNSYSEWEAPQSSTAVSLPLYANQRFLFHFIL